jgi:hypothetical protein
MKRRREVIVDLVNIMLDFGNAINLIAVLFLMRVVIIDRNILRGFSVSGVLLTCISISCFEIAYLFLDNSLSFAIGLVTLTFWSLAFIFSIRKYTVKQKEK